MISLECDQVCFISFVSDFEPEPPPALFLFKNRVKLCAYIQCFLKGS